MGAPIGWVGRPDQPPDRAWITWTSVWSPTGSSIDRPIGDLDAVDEDVDVGAQDTLLVEDVAANGGWTRRSTRRAPDGRSRRARSRRAQSTWRCRLRVKCTVATTGTVSPPRSPSGASGARVVRTLRGMGQDGRHAAPGLPERGPPTRARTRRSRSTRPPSPATAVAAVTEGAGALHVHVRGRRRLGELRARCGRRDGRGAPRRGRRPDRGLDRRVGRARPGGATRARRRMDGAARLRVGELQRARRGRARGAPARSRGRGRGRALERRRGEGAGRVGPRPSMCAGSCSSRSTRNSRSRRPPWSACSGARRSRFVGDHALAPRLRRDDMADAAAGRRARATRRASGSRTRSPCPTGAPRPTTPPWWPPAGRSSTSERVGLARLAADPDQSNTTVLLP